MHDIPPEVEAGFRRDAIKFKEKLPDKILNKPELFFGLALYLNAWFDLDTERDRIKYKPITRSMCFAFADDYDLDEEMREDLWFYIHRMDIEFLTWWRKKQPKPRRGKRGANPKSTSEEGGG